MSTPQLVLTVLLVALLVGVGGFFFWRQVQALRAPLDENMPPEDRRYFRRQAWQRLAGSVLLALLAVGLAGTFFLEDHAQRIAEERAAVRNQESPPPLTETEKDFVRFYGWYWIALLLLLMALVGLALFDLIAIRRYGRRHLKKIQDERRAMIQRQATRLRQERNGHN